MTQQEFDSELISEFKKYIGIKEIPENQGWYDKNFQKLMEKYGWKLGYAWCILFDKMIYMEVLTRLFPGNPNLITLQKTLKPGVINTYNACKQSDLFNFSEKPQDCSIGFFSHGGGLGHGVFIVNSINTNLLNTIEGNTNEAGSREGDCVANKSRKITHIPKMNFLGSAKLLINKW